MDLLELRNEIDKLDDELIPLLLKRMDISRQVAEYKVKNGIPVLNEKRELEILDDVASKCGEQGEAMKTVFSAIMDASRALQHKIIGGGDELRTLINSAKNGKNLTAHGEPIACQGVQGAYSGKTAEALFPDSPIIFTSSLRMFLRLLTKTRPVTVLFPLRIQPQARCMNLMI